MSATITDVAIIGAGLGGCLLALALRKNLSSSLVITIYESRAIDAPELASGVVLTPNGLTILDKLGVYSRIKDMCWSNGYRTYKNDKDETTRRILTSSVELYGFKNHRLYRRVLLQTLRDMCNELGVDIRYQHRFEGITSDSPESVTFTISNASHTTDLLFGADGIYSSVRKHITPLIPEYTGTTGVLAHINWSSVSWPTPDFDRQCTIQGAPGAFFLYPETPSGEEVMVGMQVKHPPLTRQGWDTLSRDQDALCTFFRRNYHEWHPTAQKIIDAVTDPDRGKSSLYLWPFLKLPRLPTWYHPTTGTVILVADAAHALPPSSGQGVNQALEDVWTLTLLLAQTQTQTQTQTPRPRPRLAALAFWQRMRQARVDRVWEWADGATGVQRMGKAERDRLIREGKVPDPEKEGSGGVEFFDDMSWLYWSEAEAEIREWVGE